MKVTILGCGRWASFHAWYQSHYLKNDVLVWGRKWDASESPDHTFERLSTTRSYEYITLPETVQFTDNLQKAIDNSKYIIISISAQSMKSFSAEIGSTNPQNKTFVLCMKGLINETGERLSEVLSKYIDPSNKIVVWVGPGHGQELVKGIPQTMIMDGPDKQSVRDTISHFKSDLIRLYEGDDVIGVEIGAAAKNVLGIVAGLLDGAGMSSLKGALMARGAYAIAKLIVAMGGKQLTAYGISHLGDYEATLFSKNSHNRMYGEMLFKGEQSERPAEGVETSRAIKVLAEKYNVEMPICELCYQILHEGKDPQEGLKELFTRDSALEYRF